MALGAAAEVVGFVIAVIWGTDSGLGECLLHPEGSRPLGRDAAWLCGLMEPKLRI